MKEILRQPQSSAGDVQSIQAQAIDAIQGTQVHPELSDTPVDSSRSGYDATTYAGIRSGRPFEPNPNLSAAENHANWVKYLRIAAVGAAALTITFGIKLVRKELNDRGDTKFLAEVVKDKTIS